MDRRPLLLIIATLCSLAASPPALDEADKRAIDTALRAIKMTERDLSFSKTNVESELVLPVARQILQQPLGLPAYAEDVLANLRSVSNLVTLSEAKGLTTTRDSQDLRFAQNDRLHGLPPQVTEAAEKIYNAALAVQPLLPKPDKAAYDAFVLDAFHDSRGQMGVDPELLRRDDALELQDTELADAILSASDRFDRGALMKALQTLAGAVDEAIAGLRTNEFTEEFQVETDTPLGKIGWFNPWLDIAAARHETADSRMFIS